MTENQWKVFCNFKNELKAQIEIWSKVAPELGELQKRAAQAANTPDYPFETAVVYNRDLDKISKEDDIRLIVIGDNPGKDEQLAKNNRYLCGQAGKIADGFFKRNTDLNINFRKNVIILNKTPVHSAKTAQLKLIMKYGGQKIVDLINESQLWMAEKTARLHMDLCAEFYDEKNAKGTNAKGTDPAFVLPELWLVGYSELKNKGFFTGYREALRKTYGNCEVWKNVFVFQHFSMNRFTIDLNEYLVSNNMENQVNLQNIHQVGEIHKKEIFG